jgi:hypothetical protein
VPRRPYVDIPFGPFVPDFGGKPTPEMPGYLVDALNIRSTPNGYRGMPAFADLGSAVAIGSTASTYGQAAAFYDSVGSLDNFFFVNSSGVIHQTKVEGTASWTNVQPSTGAALDGAFGSFVQVGGDVLYIGQTRAPIKKTLSAAEATLFTNLAGSPPIAFAGARVREHVVLGNLVGVDRYAVQWGAIGDHEDWPTPGSADARAKQAGRQSLPQDLGVVQAVMGGEKIGIIGQEYGLTRMTYVGGSVVYEFDTFARDTGWAAYYSKPVTDGRLWYWMTNRGAFATDGYSVKRLTEGTLDEGIFINSLSHPDGDLRIAGARTTVYDDRRQLVIFSNGQEPTGATPSGHRLCYNVADGQFSLMNSATVMTLFHGHISSIRGTYNVNLSNRKLQKLTATTSTAAFQTGYIELDPGYRVNLVGAHLLGAGAPGSLALSYKASQTYDDCNVSQSGFTAMTASPRGILQTAISSAPFYSFRVTGTISESQLIRGIRVYFDRGEPQ